MRLNFKDKTLALNYLQIKLKEQYNPDILITKDYYETSNNNYGFTHFIARYLTANYPPLQSAVTEDNKPIVEIDSKYDSTLDEEGVAVLPDETFNSTISLTDTISITNYFLCNNKGEKLTNNLLPDINGEIVLSNTSVYQKIYGDDICRIFNILDPPLFTSYTALKNWDASGEQIKKPTSLAPLIKQIEMYHLESSINKTAAKDRIYYLEPWTTEKGIAEIDDLVLSYLLGKTITPNSSAEDIYYVQKLFYGDVIPEMSKGIWASDYANLTDTIIEYQKIHVTPRADNTLFVTGYFDIFTEASILRDRGEQTYGIYGL